MSDQMIVDKMRDLMSTLDTLKRYARIRDKFKEITLVFLISILGATIAFYLIDLYDYYTVTMIGALYFLNGYFSATLVVAPIIIVGFVAIYLIIKRAYNLPTNLNWEQDLNEGILGIIKILSRYNWEEVLREIRYAKHAFVMITILKFILYYILTFIILFFILGVPIYTIIEPPITISTFEYILEVGSLFITLPIMARSISELYDKIWNSDILIDDIRRLQLEWSERKL